MYANKSYKKRDLMELECTVKDKEYIEKSEIESGQANPSQDRMPN